MRFRALFENDDVYVPSKEEIRRFDLVRNGFGEVVEYEDLVVALKVWKKDLKFPYHGQLNFILNNSKDIGELLHHLKRWNKSLPEKLQLELKKIKGVL